MASLSALEINNVSAKISEALSLNDIDLTLQAGEVVSIIGPNGAGKTSLLRAICNELPIHAGTISLSERAINEWLPASRARLLAILPQRSSLDFPFTVNEVVTMGRIPHDTSHRRNQQIVSEALALVDCEQFAARSYISLSGGEKQRVQLARVAAQIWEEQDGHRCLILDEPSSSLDLAHQEMVLQMIRSFAAKGVAVLTVLHDLNLASKCAHRIMAISEGTVAACGSPAEVLTQELLSEEFNISASISTNERDGSVLVVT